MFITSTTCMIHQIFSHSRLLSMQIEFMAHDNSKITFKSSITHLSTVWIHRLGFNLNFEASTIPHTFSYKCVLLTVYLCVFLTNGTFLIVHCKTFVYFQKCYLSVYIHFRSTLLAWTTYVMQLLTFVEK